MFVHQQKEIGGLYKLYDKAKVCNCTFPVQSIINFENCMKLLKFVVTGSYKKFPCSTML